MNETLKIPNSAFPHSKLAQKLAAPTGYQEAATQGVFIFRSVDEFVEMTEKDVSEWPSLLRKDGNKIEMHFPPGPKREKFRAALKKFKKKKTEYLLKNEIAITPEQSAEAHEKVAEENKVKLFLDKNPGFEMEVKNKIYSLHNAPDGESEPKKEAIYENALFFLEISFRKLLILNLKVATKEGVDFQKVAKELTTNFIDTLDNMANGQYIEYHELLPKENEVCAPEVKELLEDSKFLWEAGDLAEKPNKKEFVSFYLRKWAGKAVEGEANVESATRFLKEARAILLQSVGGKQLSRDEFREIWEEEISKDPAAAELLEVVENDENEASQNFNELLEKEEAEIVEKFTKEEDRHKRIQSESNSNPYGFFLRRYGDLSSALLFAGRDILGGIILVNFALAKFNPITLLSNPVAWATVGGIAAIAKYFNPSLFEEKTDIKKAAEGDLKNKIKNLREHHPKVREWLVKFGKGNLDDDGEIGKLLAEKGRTSITSAEIENFLEEDDRPTDEILGDSPEAKLLFQFFKACQNKGIDPKNLENV